MSMDTFFQQIVYSAANEDPESERRALRLGPTDRVLCITGSGARPLDLLIDGPERIVAVDFNVRQNHLLELKMAAIAQFERDECLSFLGVTPGTQRMAQFAALEERLSDAARAYWRSEPAALEGGVMYCGVWESYMRKVKRVMPRRKLLQQLITAKDLVTQRALYARWNNWVWAAGMKPLGWRWVWKTVLKEPGIEFVPESVSVSDHLMASFERAATERLLWTNPYIQLMFGDGYHEEAMPLHLQPGHYEALRGRLDRIELVHAPLVTHLAEHEGAYTAFSVSDFSSYADPTMYRSVWEALLHAAAPGARVCERFFLVRYEPHTLFPGAIERDGELERQLQEDDHTYIYSFNCATVLKAGVSA